MKKQLANCITMSRVLGSILMLFFPVFSVPFYAAYLLCGISDMVDGTVARRTNSVSESGAKFDTAADLIFAAAALAKLLPALQIPGWLWIGMGIIASIKISSIMTGWIHRKKLVSIHTTFNKATGLLLFLLPLTLQLIELRYSSAVVCAVAMIAAIQERYYVGTGREIA